MEHEDQKTNSRIALVERYCLSSPYRDVIAAYKNIFILIANQHDEELSDYVLEQLLIGCFQSSLLQVMSGINKANLSATDVIAVCAVHNSSRLINVYLNHYKAIGISHFVFIDNASDDNSLEVLRKYHQDVSIDVWHTDDRFDSFKAMGWKQRIFYYYGFGRWYLNLDIDELFIYPGIERGGIRKVIEKTENLNQKTVGAILIDMYPNVPILSVDSSADILKTYVYFDKDTYSYEPSEKFVSRIYGGPRTRLFSRHPSLQKFPLILIEDTVFAVNPHFWYPYETNSKTGFTSALLHYKFLPGDIELYGRYAKSGVHWDNSSQYKSYVNIIENNPEICFYDPAHSIRYVDSSSITLITGFNTVVRF
jgi:hypothetical protein